ncbi:MAG TPA: HepT-like ribonuclease domain-containing protein [Terracidiphilus sp.]|nr:HepT-like ribonuclease domain-containing protein [Terracidiphilus sp.]
MKDDRVYLQQILECIRNIREFVWGIDNAAFLQDRKTQSAVILQLALIGELAKRVSAPVRAAIDVPWKEIAGFRDRAIHDYFQIDLQIAWDTIALDLEPLAVALREYLDKNQRPRPPN